MKLICRGKSVTTVRLIVVSKSAVQSVNKHSNTKLIEICSRVDTEWYKSEDVSKSTPFKCCPVSTSLPITCNTFLPNDEIMCVRN